MIGVTVSIGCAFRPANSMPCEILVEAADKALYRAKKSGRNRVVVADGKPAKPEYGPFLVPAA